MSRPSSARRSPIARLGRTLGALAIACAPAIGADPWDRLTDAAAQPPTEARKALEALLLDNPSFYAAHYDLGTLLLPSDPETAATHLIAASAAPSRDLAADAWHNLALARWSQGRLDDALAASVRAAELNPALVPMRDQMRQAVLVRLDQARLQAEADAKKLRLPSATLERAVVGESYDTTLRARGGAGGYRYALAAKAKLPDGFTLEPDGRLHGTPAAPGRHELTVEVSDSAKATATGTVTLEILPPPTITTATLPEAVAGVPYRAEIAQNGLDSPSWTCAGLPDGLSIAPGPSATGVISGTPTAGGAARLEVVAKDRRRGATREYELLVSDDFAPDVGELPPATAWADYTQRVGVRGPALDYRWELSAPVPGMAMAADGTLSGAPQQAGPLEFPVTITARGGIPLADRSHRSRLTLPVNPPPVIDEHDPIALTQGKPVERRLKASGGTPPLAWTLGDGALPQGLRLDADGVLRGATSAVGESTVTVALKDRWQAATEQRLTVKVEAAKDAPKDQQKQGDQQQKPDDQKKPGDQQQKPDDQKKPGDQQQKPDDQQKPGDQQKPDDQKDQAKDQQAKDQQAKDQQAKDQQAKDQQAKDQQAKDQQAKDQQAKDQQAKNQQAKDQPPESGDAAMARTQDHPDPAQQRAEAATARWLETLPAENRDALRDQLLHNHARPEQRGKPW